MEEKKSSKTVKMKVNGTENHEEEHKLTYEQLNDACNQLYQQNQTLLRRLQQLDMANMFKRLDYLFLVLKYEEVIDDYDFVRSCVSEIKEALTIEQPEEEKQKEN